MLRKITIKDLKVGDVFTQDDEYKYSFVVTHIDGILWTNEMMRVTFDWINEDGDYLQDCSMVIGNETEIYRFII